MIRRFFPDKTNTIIEGSMRNMGLNPIMQVAYGHGVMRGLIHFDMDEIGCLVEDKVFADTKKLKFTLKMTNCGSIDSAPRGKSLVMGDGNGATRTSSFDLMLFELPCEFDTGIGYDYVSDFWIKDCASVSKEGSNWYFATTGIPWDYENSPYNLNDPDLNWVDVRNHEGLPGGIYSKDELCAEFEKFMDGKKSKVVAVQHFDTGMENIEMDITAYINKCLREGFSNGLCLSFTPVYESIETGSMRYASFFTDRTNTFFHPCLEADYSEIIMDNRLTFKPNATNRLYLYVSDCGTPVNLDTIPTCEIEGKNYRVSQATKGVYYAEIGADSKLVDTCTIYTDKWSNLSLNGASMDDVELEFTVDKSMGFSVGDSVGKKVEYVPFLHGVNDAENVNRHEIREVTVDFQKKFDGGRKVMVDGAWYRLYVKDASRELTVIDWQPVEMSAERNFFMLYTTDLIPNTYYVDIRVRNGRSVNVYKSVLRFDIVSDVTVRYE